MTKPTIHLSNWASRNPPHRGPGRAYTIMANPRHWEHGEGRVPACTPTLGALQRVQGKHRSGRRLTLEQYRAEFLERIGRHDVRPGRLEAIADGGVVLVGDGDTLCCACSRSAATKGECHRVWAAEVLAENGWRVVLDGVPL